MHVIISNIQIILVTPWNLLNLRLPKSPSIVISKAKLLIPKVYRENLGEITNHCTPDPTKQNMSRLRQAGSITIRQPSTFKFEE